MTTDTLSPHLRTLLAALSEQERARLARRIVARIQALNAARIAAQQQPDGARFEPRQPQSSRYPAAQAKLRRPLFERLRDKTHLKIRAATPGLVEVGFSARDEAIARVHHYGLTDQVSPRLRVRYPIRKLLGITPTDVETIAEEVLNSLRSPG